MRKFLFTKRKTVEFALFYILATFLFMFIPYSDQINSMIAAITIGVSIIFVIRNINSELLMIISLFIAYSNYSIAVGIYLDKSLRPEYLYPQLTDVNVYGKGISLLLFFTVSLIFLIPRIVDKRKDGFSGLFIKRENYNIVLFLGLMIVFFFILFMGYTRVVGSRGSSSALYEYNVIILLLMFFYCGDKRILKIICLFCGIVYALTSFLNGTRVEAISCLILVYLCFFRKKLPSWIVILGMLGGIMLMNGIGMFRGNYGSISDATAQAVQALIESKFVFNTCTHAYFPMLCMIEVFTPFSIFSACHFFARFIGTIIVGVNRIPDGNLIAYVRDFYYHNNGGVTIGFYYVWFSWFGPVIFASVLRGFMRVISSIEDKKTNIRICAVLYLVITVPRWYLYGPWNMTRGVLICVIAYLLTYNFHLLIRPKRYRGGN